MGKSQDEVREIKERYQTQYFKPPVNSCGISNIGLQSQYTPSAKTQLEKEPLKPSETLEDLCISVSFETEPVKVHIYPTEFEGVRVFYRVGGTIRPL